MIDCIKLIHPFKNDPGTSQRDRVDPELLSGKTAIDNRSLADLLDFFVQLSRHVQYYDENLQISDWQAFFSSSLPFTLAAIAKYNRKQAADRFLGQRKRFLKHPTKGGLFLELRSLFVLIKKINGWHQQVAGKQSALDPVMEKMMKDKLGSALKQFISYANAATNKFGTNSIDFTTLAANPAWMLHPSDLTIEDTSYQAAGSTYLQRLLGLYDKIYQLLPIFEDSLRLFSTSAEMGLEQSLIPLQEELRERHPPHLAIIFSFLSLFKHLQSDLNRFTKKHLDHFYQQVLRLKPKPGKPDHAHLVIEIQKQLDSYLLKKGIAFKDGKDANKTDIIFASDDELVANKAKVKEQRTLFLQHAPVRFSVGREDCRTFSVLEGVHIAPDATMANGVDKPFAEPGSRETLGAKWSKYRDPENDFLYPYPNARLGFVLASPVLYLQEGTRKVTISIPCQSLPDFCASQQPERPVANPCCDDRSALSGAAASATLPVLSAQNTCQDALPSRLFLGLVQNALKNTYYHISRPIIASLVAKGISNDLRDKLEALLLTRYRRPGKADTKAGEKEDPALCYCGREEYVFETVLTAGEYTGQFNAVEQDIMKELIYPRKALNVMFSGEKGWVKPEDQNLQISITNISGTNFTLEIISTILPEQDKIGFYDADLLKEDLHAELPVVKVELDDKIKIEIPADNCRDTKTSCCGKPFEAKTQEVSLYHFFRDVKASSDTKIDVQVCGVKEFVVQNDESLQNVNAPVYPFGTRPEVIDFDIKKPLPPLNNLGNLNLIGPNFYIGSREILLKKWNSICVNIDWKDLPNDFHEYYKGYLKQGALPGLDKNRFLINIAVLENGRWKEEQPHGPVTSTVAIMGQPYHDRKLFDHNNNNVCGHVAGRQTIALQNQFFPLVQRFKLNKNKADRYEVSTRDGFIRMNLQVQDFCHKEYSYVLARQMMALGKLPDGKIEDAIYYDATTGNLIVFNTNLIKTDVLIANTIAERVRSNVNDPNNIADRSGLAGPISASDATEIRRILASFPAGENLMLDVAALKARIISVENVIGNSDKFQAVIPNEPWTPIIKSISLDYTATATADNIDLIHLYPYAGTFKPEELEQGAMLFPSFCDEGNFYIGLEELVPGSTLSMLLQFAEATADSESEREKPVWYYLENNRWKLMREGFEVLSDATNGLTTSGIVRFTIPGNISKENTILPGSLHWLRVSVPCKTTSVSELMGIHAQAVKVTFTNEATNDKLRLDTALPAGSISKLQEADSSVSKIGQPYESFGGTRPEEEGHFYVRVSELLRHKNRGIQKFDYERLVLENFPSVFKTKCINHTYGLNANEYINDFTIAPGYVLVAVIPDMTKLKAAGSFEPKVPVSLIEAIEENLRKIISPFVRLKVMNPRYEKVNLCIRVKLLPDKDEVYYKEKLNRDIRNFLAPWAIGEHEKLSFGQPVYRSDIIRFLETLDYVDYIIELHMVHDEMKMATLSIAGKLEIVQPVTARSILIAGSVDVCIDNPGCESWCRCRGEDCCDHEPVTIRRPVTRTKSDQLIIL
ncbi:hypothetical protein [Dyadobacter bucti]|uniref:hypothetical protein n=1 Tax=Dyadobacter bucti TaxID=2572203 RepID=UPI00110855E7|nr:hypothetical protein [Dyadobacter bucti]